jgi:hypothetical protein
MDEKETRVQDGQLSDVKSNSILTVPALHTAVTLVKQGGKMLTVGKKFLSKRICI